MKKEQGGIRQTFDFFYFAVRFFCEKYGKVRVFCSVVLGEILPTPLAPYTTHSTKGGGGSHLAWRREGRREGKAGKSFSFFFSSPFISLPSSPGATPPPPLALPHLGRIEWKEEEEAIIIIVLSLKINDQRRCSSVHRWMPRKRGIFSFFPRPFLSHIKHGKCRA